MRKPHPHYSTPERDMELIGKNEIRSAESERAPKSTRVIATGPIYAASLALILVLALVLSPTTTLAQDRAGTGTMTESATQNPPLEIGALAPDFELPGATRYGVLADPVRLSDFEGKTVVLAFFFRARTPG